MLETADVALIIPSPSHALPELTRTDNVFIAENIAPEGWREGVQSVLNKFL
jgi:predicted mannosyl-3-phosphoglycerate phosphatase (HAD superfamily)